MLKIGKTTKMGAEEVIRKAVDFFGPNGYKLEVKEQGEGRAYFQGGGGGIEVSTCAEDDKTSVDITSTEWDYQVKEFMRKLK